jgi:hypothetical protein
VAVSEIWPAPLVVVLPLSAAEAPVGGEGGGDDGARGRVAEAVLDR